MEAASLLTCFVPYL